MKAFIEANKKQMYQTLEELCAIPAPSHFEHQRAEYCKKWLEDIGAKGVYIDEALNVIFSINCEGSDTITVFAAHTDTVFPDMEPMPYTDDGVRIHSPGVGDDTASVVVLMNVAKYYVENNIQPPHGVMFVLDSCEEGLGNLKGMRQLFKDFDGRIAQFITLDGRFENVVNVCVGSHRYEVEVLTEGGHSYNLFGNRNAIAELSKIINEIYAIEVPKIGNSKTTYNVGSISGGTSVNTIAQSAKMLCEYRSDNAQCLAIMQEHFERIFEAARQRVLDLRITLAGERPCMGNVDSARIDRLAEIYGGVIKDILNIDVARKSASTDCNIPLSLGIPAVCIGVWQGSGSHTREEWIEKASLPIGLEVGLRVVADILKEA